MSEHTLGRRQMLRRAGIAAGGVAVTGLAAASPAEADDDDGHGRTGSWLITRHDNPPADPTPQQSVVGFARGGVLQVLDINPAVGSGLGTWAPRDDGRFRASFWAGDAASGSNPAVTVNVHVQGRMSRQQIQGTYSYVVFNAATGATLATVTGSFVGTRIVP